MVSVAALAGSCWVRAGSGTSLRNWRYMGSGSLGRASLNVLGKRKCVGLVGIVEMQSVA